MSDTAEDTLELPAALLDGLRGMAGTPEPSQDGELWDPERLEQHGRFLATEGGLVYGSSFHARDDLKQSLRANARALESAYAAIVGALQAGRAISPAAQWIVDNFHVISDHLNDIPVRLSPRQWRRLPGTAHAGTSGPPRVLLIAAEYLRHTLWDFSQEMLIRLLRGYQDVAPLKMHEVWVLHTVLRIALIDELRRIAVRVEESLAARAVADELADSLAQRAAPGAPVQSLRAMAWPQGRLTTPFVVQLAHRLQGLGERGRPLLHALSQQLAAHGTSIDDYIQRQHARRSGSNLAARNIITSLRSLASIDWRLMFEKASRVEALLRERPDYVACDRRTRDRYRASIEQLARATRRPEPAITADILGVIAASASAGSEADMGAWLIGPRHVELEKALRCPVSMAQWLRRAAVRHGAGLYLGSIGVLTVALAVLALGFGTQWREISPGMLGLLAVLSLFPLSELVIAVMNRQWLRVFPPRHLPCLELEAGLTAAMKTLVVVPTMLRSVADAAEACRQLHVHGLAAPDPQIRFALLSDWTDSDTETRVDDAIILAAVRQGIAALNADEPVPGGEPKYYVLHRRRLWNASEGRFIGWERKRGKLEELNRLLLGRGETSFLPDASGHLAMPAGVRYVLTVDADTRLPLGSVRALVGTAAHPLNRPQVSAAERRVVAGYAVLQPHITPLLPAVEEHSLYREIVTSGSGVDPYAAAVSDLHQDLFGEGQFTGKGLYDLSTWDAVLRDRVPTNAVLSHDLFEGLFARCGLVSDVELFEDFPSHSEVAASRSHRWIRGDWQLLPWILGRRGALPPMGRWKMLDNLRRSLLAPCSMALLIAAFAEAQSQPLWWLLVVVSPALWPAFMNAVELLVRTPAARSRRMHLRRLLFDFGGELERAAVSLALLAQNAWLAIDAIARALYRMFVSRRHLLEWVTAAQSKAGLSGLLSSFVWPLKSASIVVVGAVAVLLLANPPAVARLAPLLLLWWLSPVVARYLSRPLYQRRPKEELPGEVDRELRGTARLTWSFFEQHVTPEDNHLPPDNFQEDPAPMVAHRTSPTNIGLCLLSTVAARDFGWLGLTAMCERLGATLASVQKLERFQGHLLNWYETRSLAALAPRYVSTVDSGNLAGHLLTLRQACIAMLDAPLLSPRAFSAPLDAIGLCRAVLRDADDAHDIRGRDLSGALRRIELRLANGGATLGAARATLQGAVHHVTAQRGAGNDALPADALRWLLKTGADIDSQLRDLQDIGTAESLPHDATLAQVALLSPRHAALAAALTDIAQQCRRLVDAMSFTFLYDRSRGLFSIGYRVADGELDGSYYDLLASEARLASLVAIACGDVPYSHWFRLGRRLTGGSRRPVLASWSGSMFEYLMPALVMREPPRSLLDQTNRRAVQQQIAYGEHHHLPWGISESACNVRDREYTYQYSGFGLPSLGLKRGLGADYVVAPYATALAAMYRPVEAAANLRVLARASARGEYGYYEAMDYSAGRVPEGRSVAVVRTYMAHHQGMSLVALDNVLQERVMQVRFHAEPAITAADLLLQERSIRFVEAPALIEADGPLSHELDEVPDVARSIEGFASSTPVTHLLSNRRYTVMLTDSGGGYSSWRARAVTRWREDATRDCWGSFIYLYDPDLDRLWSAGFQPTATIPDEYHVHFNEECAFFVRRDGTLHTTMAVVVAPDDDGELRRITLRNDGSRARRIEVTSYAEVVLAPQRADIAHPGFSNLFVQTEYLPESGALLAKRRPRSEREAPLWAMHVMAAVQGDTATMLQYETDRYRFVGRGNGTRAPQAVQQGRHLSDTVGNVLDPIFSLRTRVTVPPRSSVTVTFATFVAETREQAVALAVKYRTPALFDHVLESAWTFVRADLHYLRSSLGEALLFQSLAAHLLLSTRQLRAALGPRERNTLDVTHLWRYAISGDRPILLIRCHSHDDLPFIQQLLRAQEYLRIKQLVVDVVILNERRHSYMQDLQQAIERTARAFGTAGEGEDRGGIHTLTLDAIGVAERALLLSLARVVVDPAQGSLQEQLSRPVMTRVPDIVGALGGTPALPPPADAATAEPLEFFNGWGGFASEEGEYCIRLAGTANTPAPWSNVLANEQFGALVTERGAMCTWSVNSRENQLTPWSNDAVGDPSGECFYLLADAGELWSPAPQPVRRPEAQYEIRHGQGYSRFDVAFRGFHSKLTVLVAADDPVKLCHLRLTNTGRTTREVTIVSYVEWTLGATRALPNHDVQTSLDPATGAQFACNPALIDFGSRIAFCDLGGRQQRCTDSRHDFLGRNGDTAAPAGLWNQEEWSSDGAPGLDACCAFAVTVRIAAGATEEFSFVLGQAADAHEARRLVQKYRGLAAGTALEEVRARWSGMLDRIRIRTPDRALDLLFNRWLPYQTIACRLWAAARSINRVVRSVSATSCRMAWP